jgi:hypothetical protein
MAGPQEVAEALGGQRKALRQKRGIEKEIAFAVAFQPGG